MKFFLFVFAFVLAAGLSYIYRNASSVGALSSNFWKVAAEIAIDSKAADADADADDDVRFWIDIPEVAVFAPLTNRDFNRTLWWISRWKRFPPCVPSMSRTKESVDLVFSHNEHFTDAQQAQILHSIPQTARECFRKVRFRNQGQQSDYEVYSSPEERWKANRNEHIRMSSVCDHALSQLYDPMFRNGSYDFIFRMESDAGAIQSGWLDALLDEVSVARPTYWIRASVHRGAITPNWSTFERRQFNGNYILNVKDESFLEYLQAHNYSPTNCGHQTYDDVVFHTLIVGRGLSSDHVMNPQYEFGYTQNRIHKIQYTDFVFHWGSMGQYDNISDVGLPCLSRGSYVVHGPWGWDKYG